MDQYQYKPLQNLDKVGSVYSKKDEKQRLYIEQVKNLRIKSDRIVNINMNIAGLDKKAVPGSKNPSTYRNFNPLSTVGKTGVRYIFTNPNISRFFMPCFFAAYYFYNVANYTHIVYWDTEWNNRESVALYPKMQFFNAYYMERVSLMA